MGSTAMPPHLPRGGGPHRDDTPGGALGVSPGSAKYNHMPTLCRVLHSPQGSVGTRQTVLSSQIARGEGGQGHSWTLGLGQPGRTYPLPSPPLPSLLVFSLSSPLSVSVSPFVASLSYSNGLPVLCGKYNYP